MKIRTGLLGAGILLGMCAAAWAGTAGPAAEEIARARAWAESRFGAAPTAGFPFSFVYGGRPSADLLPKWAIERASRRIDDARTEREISYRDPDTGLIVVCRAVEYADFPTVEWTLDFKNGGAADTQVLSEIHPLDVVATRGSGEFILHWNKGDTCAPDSYQPMTDVMGPGAARRMAPEGGRPTNGGYPFWNIEAPGASFIAVIGWAGQWSASFERDAGAALRVRAGQELARFRLRPGEAVRSPLAVIQFYEGDWIRGQNIWRRWMVAHNLPRLDGKPIRPFASACNGNHYPGIITNAATELEFMRRYLEEGVQPDYWWEDAGWYKCGDPPDWVNTGTWEVDPSRWPRGMREVSDWCRERNIRTIVWFEPERVAPGTWLSKNHPEWILPGKTGASSGLLNIGDPACRRWITDRIDSVITGQGVDLYRQDFNIDPLPFWRANDGEDRWGITEIRHVEGYLAFWDELKRRHNGMLIDSCASGGRRNDLETLRRAVPLLRSDNIFDPLAEQCHTHGISFWVPFSGTGYMTFDEYLIRSTFGAAMTLGVDTRKKDGDYAMLRKAYSDWKKVAPCFLGDYYPLTPHSLEKDAWMGWQFDLPETGAGMVQAFRREACSERTRVLRLRGLMPKAAYRVDDLDTGSSVEMPGRTLMEEGFVVKISGQPGSAIFSYTKIR